jgi:FeS assembly SUF system protein
MEPASSEKEMKEAMGAEAYDAFATPPNVVIPAQHPLWPRVEAALREVYDPEIPVNIYELGLIYKVEIQDFDTASDIEVTMTLTSPACPVAQEMPGMVQAALFPVEGVGNVDVQIIWEPPWDPSLMAETAKLQLNMFT